ncbi:hypothetical protein [Kitasatospora sp. NPDC057223]|uniref:hypothetical protein n=1 Tax=Kitasatospora sp. NPDC057223 TaxID=3346055 RepID=UPI003629A93D
MVRRIVGVVLGLVLAGIATLLMVQVAHHRYVWAYFIAMPLYLAAVFCAGAREGAASSSPCSPG